MCGHSKVKRSALISVAQQTQTNTAEVTGTPEIASAPENATALENVAAVVEPSVADVESAQTELQDDAQEFQRLAAGGSFATAPRPPITTNFASRVAMPAAPQVGREEALRAAQDDIVARFGTIHITLPKKTFFKEEGGYLPAHLFDVIAGCGLTLAHVHDHHDGSAGTADLHQPDLLFYAPKDPHQASLAAVGGTFTDVVPDGDYVLIGWGYYSDYVPGQAPILPGIDPDEWFVHEAGFHTLDGGFATTRPREDRLGAVAAAAPFRKDHPGAPLSLGAHGRVWDLHVWRTDLLTGKDSAPVVDMWAPEDHPLIPAETAKLLAGAFFYPETPSAAQSLASNQ